VCLSSLRVREDKKDQADKDSAKQDGCCASSAASMCQREPLKDKSSDKSSTPAAPITK
jgi:hypothetical protein